MSGVKGNMRFHVLLIVFFFCLGRIEAIEKCPSGHIPLKNSTLDEFVPCNDIDSKCPKNYRCILNEGRNGSAAVDGACCPKVEFAPGESRANGDGCPLGARPLRNSNGQMLVCSTAVPTTCPMAERVACYTGNFGPICCIAEAAYCPVGFDPYNYPGTMLPLICGPTTIGTCPFGYECFRSSEPGGPYACCRQRQAPAGVQCPSGYQPYINGQSQTVTCLVGNPSSCPSPAVCAPSSNPFQNYCCVRIGQQTGQLQCPTGYALPVNGMTVPCTVTLGPSTGTCPFGSGCKPSIGRQGGVCCRSLARCPSGYREVTDSATQEVVECSSTAVAPPTCPQGSTCLLSSTTVSSLCCTDNTPPGGQCPVGYDQVQPLVFPCQVDGQCPFGSQCIQRTCCRPRVAQRCPNGYNALTDQNNNPIFCIPNDRWCPTALSSCLQSVTSASFICCEPGAQQFPQCPGGATVVLTGGQPTACDSNPNICPTGSACQTSVIPSIPLRICCQSSTPIVFPQCPADMTITLFGGQPIACDGTSTSCPPGSTCQTSVVPTTPNRICCQPEQTALPQCPASRQLALGTDGRPIFCPANTCPGTTATCERATNMQVDVCCLPETTPTPVGDKSCPTGYRPQSNAGQAVSCDPSAVDPCLNSGFCLPSLLESGDFSADTICCDANGVQCPPGFNRPDGSTAAPTCDPSGANACRTTGPGYLCMGGVGTGVTTPRPFVCCQRSALCTSGRIPFYGETYQPETCVINRPNDCASAYRCELSSTEEGKSVCCPRPRAAGGGGDEDGANTDGTPINNGEGTTTIIELRS